MNRRIFRFALASLAAVLLAACGGAAPPEERLAIADALEKLY